MRSRVRHPVLLALLLAGLAAALGLSFVTQAPNRLLSGVGVPLTDVIGADSTQAWALSPVLLLIAAALRTPTQALTRWLTLLGATGSLAGLTWLAGSHASALLSDEMPLGRTSLGGGYWLMAILSGLAAAEALRGWSARAGVSWIGSAFVVTPVVALLMAYMVVNSGLAVIGLLGSPAP